MASEEHGTNLRGLLQALRRVGWAEWDPIGLFDSREHCEDEYDSYLLVAAASLLNGSPLERVVDYLVHIETDYMGLPAAPDARTRARKTAEGISSLLGS
jgi:hypothetical protein